MAVKIKYLTEMEQEALFKAIKRAKNPRDTAMFSLALHLGLRLSEILHRETKLYVRRVKGSRNFRFNLMDRDVKLIRNWLKARKTFADAEHNPYLFITRRSANGMMTPQGFQFLMKRYCDKAGISMEKAHPHVLKHSCAVNILMSGEDVFSVQEVLGHVNIQSSMKYLELGLPEKIKRLNGVLEKAHKV